ncbi:MAG: SH3 domain-containing protein [Spirochaetales bacterium]|nr:SH3 domain-containing protein [Spirochaetales bacterium]
MSRLAAVFIVSIVLSLISVAGCSRSSEARSIKLPPTPAFSNRQKWGVIITPHLRLRQQPMVDSRLVTTFWNPGNIILEILSQTSVKETIDDQSGYWYQISYDGLTGWVFGGHVEIVDSREEALKRTRQLQ